MSRWDGPEDYWIIRTGSEEDPGITGGIASRTRPGDTSIVIFDVASVDDAVQRVIKSGGSIRESRRPIPGVGYLATCIDTEGNSFGVMEIDDNAA